MERFLREWRNEAEGKCQYDTAIFIGDKVFALTDSDNDALSLAQIHFKAGNYSRAQNILSIKDLDSRNVEATYLSGYCSIKQNRHEEALQILGEKNPEHLILATGARRKIARVEGLTRNGNSKHPKASSRLDVSARSEDERESHNAGYIRIQASMCFLRGLCYAKQNAFDRACECYKTAVRIDVQCFEAFDQLMRNALMSPTEEWRFLESLNFDAITVPGSSGGSASQQAGELTKMLYMTRMSKYKNSSEFTGAIETLSTHYRLSRNPDLLLSKAELLFTQCKFRESLALTTQILERDRYNFACLPTHLACLHELQEKNALFLLAHDLADHHPDEPATWLAVGVYYLTINKIGEARRYFSKSSMMDPHFGPAWIGFAHTFAAEGEHDQAISAYSTAARLFQGSHLPQLFLGIQNLQLQNMTLAQEYLNGAYELCQTDPLLLNEMGVVMYHEERIEEAISIFRRALEITTELSDESLTSATSTRQKIGQHQEDEEDTDAPVPLPPSDLRSTVPLRTNLAHAYRRLGEFDAALQTFDECIQLGGRDCGVHAARGLCLLELGRPRAAVLSLHEALAVQPSDAVASDLLSRALEECASADSLPNALDGSFGSQASNGGDLLDDDAAVEDALEELLLEQGKKAATRTRSGAGVTMNREVDKGKQKVRINDVMMSAHTPELGGAWDNELDMEGVISTEEEDDQGYFDSDAEDVEN